MAEFFLLLLTAKPKEVHCSILLAPASSQAQSSSCNVRMAAIPMMMAADFLFFSSFLDFCLFVYLSPLCIFVVPVLLCYF